MRRTPGKTLVWLAVYLVLAGLPLAVVLLGALPPARSFWVEVGVAVGFVGLSMLGLQFALTARFRSIAGAYGIDTLLHFHRQAGIVAVSLVFLHPIILFLAEPVYLVFLDPRVMVERSLALIVLLGATVLLVVMTFRRKPLGIPYEWWRATHGLLAFLILFIGLVHVLRVGYYISTPWKQGVWIGFTVACLLLLVDARLVRPLRSKRRPFRVTEVRKEAPRVWTLVLEAEGHPGLAFEAGQYVWLTLGDSPFSLRQHPFSIASSADQEDRLELTVKELGDYTAALPSVAPGSRAFLEGPYGAFTPDPAAEALVLVAGGIGITPMMSILRTLRDRRDRRPLLLLYANVSEEDIVFREELRAMEGELDLRVVYIVEEAGEGWQGERGRIAGPLLARTLDDLPQEVRAGTEYFICGPEPMMDVAEAAIRARGTSLFRVRSERFNIA